MLLKLAQMLALMLSSLLIWGLLVESTFTFGKHTGEKISIFGMYQGHLYELGEGPRPRT